MMRFQKTVEGVVGSSNPVRPKIKERERRRE
jgi:hypothetical protein